MLNFNLSNDLKIIKIIFFKKLRIFILLTVFLSSTSFLYVFNKSRKIEKSMNIEISKNVKIIKPISKEDLIDLLKKVHKNYINANINDKDPIESNFFNWYNNNIVLEHISNNIQIIYKSSSEDNINIILNSYKKFFKNYIKNRIVGSILQNKNNFIVSLNKLIEYKLKYNINGDNSLVGDKGILIPSLKSNLIIDKSLINFYQDKDSNSKFISPKDKIEILTQYNLLLINAYTDAMEYVKEYKESRLINKPENSFSPNESILENNVIFTYSEFRDISINKFLLIIILIAQSLFVSAIISYCLYFYYEKISENYLLSIFSRHKLLKNFKSTETLLWKPIFESILKNNRIIDKDIFGIYLMNKENSIKVNEFVNYINENFSQLNIIISHESKDLIATTKSIILYTNNQVTASEIRLKEDILDELYIDIIGSIFFDDKVN